MILESGLEYIWHFTTHNVGSAPTERDYLRGIHHPPGLCIWAYSLNHELLDLKLPRVSITSIWVDHTPQCWFGSSAKRWAKPSCELADLLVVVWDDKTRKSGRALLVQAKRGKSHSKICVSNPSTNKEFQLLSMAPKFLLSNQTSTIKGTPPSPVSTIVNCEFQLLKYNGKRLRHCTFLQIRDSRAKRWPQNQYQSWQTIWPPSSHRGTYSDAIINMVAKSPGAMGEPFSTQNQSTTDWDRLITLLINETVAVAGGTSQGSRQNTVVFGRVGDFDGVQFVQGEYPVSDDPRGISTIFVTPESEG